MSATLEIINSLSMESNGSTTTAKQGATTDVATEPFDLTVAGSALEVKGSLATASGKTLWDEDNDVPVDLLYGHFWADQDCYLQLIGQSTNVTVPISAKVPFVFGAGILAAANTTVLSAEPSLEDLDSVRVWNESGNTMNYRLVIIL